MSNQFADEVSFEVKAGDGGNGAISFRREKFVSKGGPDGGDGGDGGSVILVATHNLNTLSKLSFKKKYSAEPGVPGRKQKSSGKKGEDLRLQVPVGTQVYDIEPDKPRSKPLLIADLSQDGQEFVVAAGGAGGYGNYRFARASFQTPAFAELGEPGEERTVTLKLKILADVGLIGLPNVGKSTLLSVISNARPKIADYEFTTLTPNLGIVNLKDTSFMVADIPGLIEGASGGKGLGSQFLRHIERTRILVHVLDGIRADIKGDFKAINKELSTYDKQLAGRPQIVAINKIELLTEDQLKALKKLKFTTTKLKDIPVYFISAATHQNVQPLLLEVARQLQALPIDTSDPIGKVFTFADTVTARFEVSKKGKKYFVTGPKQEKLITRTDLENAQALGRMLKVFNRMGVLAELKKIGAKPGDIVQIAKKEFEYENI